MTSDLEIGLYIFLLAGFLGYHIITRVPPLLHTPLMSATNAISGISLIGSLVVTGADYSPLSTILGTIAVACSSTNVVGGFLITDRMLKMFKRKGDQVDRARQRLAGTILTAAMSLGVTLSVTRAGWVRRTWRRWLQGLVLILLVFGAALVGTSGDFRTEQPAFSPEAIETASRLLGALVVVASVYSTPSCAAGPDGRCRQRHQASPPASVGLRR